MGENETCTSSNNKNTNSTPSTIKERDENIPSSQKDQRIDQKNNSKSVNNANISTTKEAAERNKANRTQIEKLQDKEIEAKSNFQPLIQEEPEEKLEDAPLPDEAESEEEADLKLESTEILKNKSDEEFRKMLLENKVNEKSEGLHTEKSSPEPQLATEENSETLGQDNSEEQHKIDEEIENVNLDTIQALQLKDQSEELEGSIFDITTKQRSVFALKLAKETNMLEFSTSTLSFERFFPGRILGNTFIVRNNSSEPIKFTLSFSSSGINKAFIGDQLCNYYTCDSLSEISDSYVKHLKSEIDISKENLSVWNVEDPYTKRLAQFIDFQLDGNCEEEFIIVLKSSLNNKQTFFGANVVMDQYENGFKNSVF